MSPSQGDGHSRLPGAAALSLVACLLALQIEQRGFGTCMQAAENQAWVEVCARTSPAIRLHSTDSRFCSFLLVVAEWLLLCYWQNPARGQHWHTSN